MPPLDIAACEAVGKWTKPGTKPGAIEGEKVNVTSNKGRRCSEEELRRPSSGCGLSKSTLVQPHEPPRGLAPNTAPSLTRAFSCDCAEPFWMRGVHTKLLGLLVGHAVQEVQTSVQGGLQTRFRRGAGLSRAGQRALAD